MTEVKTDIYVTSFGPVSDADMVKYSDTECFFISDSVLFLDIVYFLYCVFI